MYTMPLTRGVDAGGPYYRWGPAGAGGAKHHYVAKNAATRELARAKATRQGRAIEAGKKRPRKTGKGEQPRKTGKGEQPRKTGEGRQSRKTGEGRQSRKTGEGERPRETGKGKTGGAGRRLKPRLSSQGLAQQKLADTGRVREAAAYRRSYRDFRA